MENLPTMTLRLARTSVLVLLLLGAVALCGGAVAADAAKRPSCYRGHAHFEAGSGDTIVVRVTARRESSHETRHENLLACWGRTGKRTVISQEVDFGDDNRASTTVQIVQGRYVGVTERNEGGVSEDISARVYDARKGVKLHDSADTCDKVDQGDFAGVDDVALLQDGGVAWSCQRLLLYRGAADVYETVEPFVGSTSRAANLIEIAGTKAVDNPTGLIAEADFEHGAKVWFREMTGVAPVKLSEVYAGEFARKANAKYPA